METIIRERKRNFNVFNVGKMRERYNFFTPLNISKNESKKEEIIDEEIKEVISKNPEPVKNNVWNIGKSTIMNMVRNTPSPVSVPNSPCQSSCPRKIFSEKETKFLRESSFLSICKKDIQEIEEEDNSFSEESDIDEKMDNDSFYDSDDEKRMSGRLTRNNIR
jgi:hypothetical protein